MPAHADKEFIADSRLELHLKDGSQLMVVPIERTLRINFRHTVPLNLDWDKIERFELKDEPSEAVLLFRNGDRGTVELLDSSLRVDSLLGPLDVPFDSIRHIEVSFPKGHLHNVALGKPVHGRDGASHGKGLAKHLTDGNPTSHAKPPASHFDYRIDLQNGTETTYHIQQILLNWGHFGDYFKGVRARDGEGWARASWPGEYVTSYTIEARKAGEQTWKVVHQHEGRPVNEDAPGVMVQKKELDGEGYSSISTTRITGLDLHGVAELRIRAKGGHWIGLFEFEAHGSVETP